jgi:hypothetical protein
MLVLLAVGRLAPLALAQQPNRAGLVVDFGDHLITRCVEFSEPEITGYAVLRRAGLELVVDASNPMGVIICDINDTSGCPASSCFCRCQGSPCIYWAYHRLVDGSWQYSQLGASSQKVHDGDVQGWAWGEGAINDSGAEPPVIPFDQICLPPTDTPTSTTTPVPSTPASSPTNTPVPPAATPTPPELVVWFRLDQNPIEAGSCTMLRWDTSHARQVYLDGEAVGTNGSREACPAISQDYRLRVVGTEGEETYHLTLGVTGSGPVPTSPQQPTAGTPSPSPTANPGEVTLPPASPTALAVQTTSTSPASGPQSTATTSSSPTGTQVPSSAPTPSPSPTAVQIAQVKPTATAVQVAQVEDAEQQPSTSDSDESRSPFLPIGYAVFSLIVGGLLGLLIYILRIESERT